MAFKSGSEWKGNASGRPRKTQEQIDFERKCREWAQLFALDKLKKAADSSKSTDIIAAVKEICDRGFGKSEVISYIEANVTTETGSQPEELAGELDALIPGTEGEGGSHPGTAPVDAGK